MIERWAVIDVVTHLKYAMGAVAILIALVIATHPRSDPEPVLPSANLPSSSAEIAADTLTKTDRLPVGAATVTERIDAAPVITNELPPEKPVLRDTPAERAMLHDAKLADICARNHMHKVWIDRYRWRCRK